MRSSALLLGTVGLFVISGCSISTTDNSITFKSKKEFVDNSVPAKTSTQVWNGEPITITSDSVGFLNGNGGVYVRLDPNATQITAQSSFTARADDDSKREDANQSIRDAVATFTITEGSEFKISCGHGQTHGSSAGGDSGCKMLTVTIPAGTAAKPLKLSVGTGNGDITFEGTAVASALTVDGNGTGNVSVSVSPTSGSRIVVTSEGAATVAVPAAFSAQTVVLDTGDGEKAAARIVTTDFPGMASGSSYPVAGATAGAAQELNVTSKGLLSDDIITIKKQ